MSGPEAKNPAPAGISSPEETDVAALFDRLREELRRGAVHEDSRGAEFASTRALAERFWPVTAERPAGGGPKGIVKRFLRKLMRWYVEPLALDQRRFNAAVLKLVDALSERADAGLGRLEQRLGELHPRVEAQGRRESELEERLTRLERRERPALAPTVPQAVDEPRGQLVFPDYFAYESRMRGATEHVREKQRAYVEDFHEAAPVVDLGCGRGEFLVLLREAGIDAKGVDVDADMVAYARGEGLDVEHTGAVEYLEGLVDGSLGGIFAAQLLEHLPASTVVRLLELAAAKLRPGGLLVAETINPLSPLALRNYFADLTHAQPLVPETLELLARQAGFANVETRFLNEPEEKLVEPADPTIAANVRRLNELLFAPLDYAIVARR